MKRDRNAFFNACKIVDKTRVFTDQDCRITVPVRWMDVGLGSLGKVVSIYGFFPIIFADGTYSVINACTMVPINSQGFSIETIEEESYYVFQFFAGSEVITSLKSVQNDRLTYNIFDELFMKGKTPWWVEVDDLCRIYDTAKKNAGSEINRIPEAIEFLVGVMARDKKDPRQYLRQVATSFTDYDRENVGFIAYSSVMFALKSTLAKVSGAYYEEGVVSALAEPSTRVSKIERILRA